MLGPLPPFCVTGCILFRVCPHGYSTRVHEITFSRRWPEEVIQLMFEMVYAMKEMGKMR